MKKPKRSKSAILPLWLLITACPTGWAETNHPPDYRKVMEELREIRKLLEQHDTKLSRIYDALEPHLDEIEQEGKKEKPRYRNQDDALEVLAKQLLPLPAEPRLPENGLIRRFSFTEGFFDEVDPFDELMQKRTQLIEGTLYLNGCYEHSSAPGYKAVAYLPGLDFKGFTFAHHFWPIDIRQGDVVVMGGTSYRWFGIVAGKENEATISMNNGRFRHGLGIRIEPQKWHHIICSVNPATKTINISYDGNLLPPVSLPEDFKLEVVGSKREQLDKNITFTNYSNGSAFHGFVDNLRVYNHALTADELKPAAE
ncbi:hypothetical protein PDESU_02274 [Pontiella desulfatans]|uniref:LamG-like jellyroll fold domain-containing protein n=1 Tax=Pontiella desulfatans TaxID=2750659 RepID=A0A6C2U1F2_PONDE|nr:LamG domain-containing protein [Pontiella desulfatans]VGO13717.1 hypothetical protein PDESU_02274 [Pontiella desulfatans]